MTFLYAVSRINDEIRFGHSKYEWDDFENTFGTEQFEDDDYYFADWLKEQFGREFVKENYYEIADFIKAKMDEFLSK